MAIRIAILNPNGLELSTQRAMDYLRKSFSQQNISTTCCLYTDQIPAADLMIGTYEKSRVLRELVDSGQLPLSLEPEAMMITEITIQDKTTLLACAYDTRGLNYALYELAERINAQSLPALYQPSQERPLLKRRGVTHFLSVEALKKGWDFSPTYWHDYFDLLVRKRFNTFTLVFEAPSFISTLLYLVDLPEHPEVHPPLFSTPSHKNLETLQRFVELTTEAGLDLYFGFRNYPGNSTLVETDCGLNQDKIESYLHLGLKQIFFSCPELKGLDLTFEGPLAADFCINTLGRAITEAGNNLILKLDSAQTTPELFSLLSEAEIKIILNNNCWDRQFGLAYLRRLPDYSPPQATTNYQLHAATRLRWGDPDYVRQLVHALNAALTSGLDLIPPDTSTGGHSTREGSTSSPFFPENYERYWFFYHLFGRLSYNPGTAGDVLIREFHRRFGEKGNTLVELYQLTGKVVPLFNAMHQHQDPTPEEYAGGLLEYYLRIPVGDPVFFSSVPEYTRAVATGASPDKISPATIAATLRQLGEEINQLVTTLQDDSLRREEVFQQEWQATLREAQLLADFAFYHSRKLEAAIELSFFTETADLTSLERAHRLLTSANRSWERMIRRAEQSEEAKMDYRLPTTAAQKRLLLLEDAKRLKALKDEYMRRGHFLIGFDFGGLPRFSAEDRLLTGVFPDDQIEQGFTAVDNTAVYDPEKGYGWLDPSALHAVSSPPVRLRDADFRSSGKNGYSAYENHLVTDYVWSRKPATFRLDLTPGTYRLHLTFSDQSGAMRRHGPMKIGVNDTILAEELIIPAGQRVDLEQELTVEGGSLLVSFDCAPHQDWFISALSISPVGPMIAHTPLSSALREEPLVISASVTGSYPLRQVILNYQIDREEGYHMITMAPQTTNLYYATIPALYLKDCQYVKYYITAYDTQGKEGAIGSYDLPYTITMKTKDFTPSFSHFPPMKVPENQDLTLKFSPRPLEKVDQVMLVYTGENQKEQQLTMERVAETEEFLGVIPGSLLCADHLLRYRFVILFKDAGVHFYPNPLQADPYFLLHCP